MCALEELAGGTEASEMVLQWLTGEFSDRSRRACAVPWTNGFSLVIAGIAFCGSHVLLSSTRLRGDQLGERGFIAVYSPTSLVVSFGSWPALRLRRRSCCGRGNDGRHSSR